MAVTLLDPAAAADAGELLVGGKAYGLARLAALGCTVPDFVVVPADAFRAHLRRAGVLDALELGLDDPYGPAAEDGTGASTPAVTERSADGGDAATGLMAAVLAEPLAADVTAALAAHLKLLGDGPWAVRSSMVGEDSSSHSFAGQLESYLFLPDLDAVLDAVRRCWASTLAPRVQGYAARAGLERAALRMGVVVQRMIDAETSAVAFTANPLTGDRNETLITAAWGQGEGIVSGLCNTDEHVWVPGKGEVRTNIADKDVQIVATPRHDGTIEVPVPGERRLTRALTEEQVNDIGELGQYLQERLGGPQDLELCFAGGVMHVLQARPVTSLPEPVNTDGPVVLWDNSNIQESYCGVTTPLTFSFASKAYARVYETFFRMVGTPESLLREKEDVLRNLLGLLDGRVYYNLHNWYEGCLLLPSARHNKGDMEAMMGVEEPVDFVVDEDVSAAEQARRTAMMVPMYARMLPQLATAERRIAEFQARFRTVTGTIDRSSLKERSFSELMDIIAMLDRELMNRWEIPILNDVRVMRTSGALRRYVAKVLGTDEADDRVIRLCNDLLAGIDGIESVEPTRMLLSMAAAARQDAALTAALRIGDATESLALVRRMHPTFAARIDEYIERYGDRVMGELKLESRSLREDPRFVLDVLRNYLDRPDLDPDAISTRERRVHDRAVAEVAERLKSKRSRASFDRRVAACRQAVKARESLRLERTRLFGIYRDVYRALGARLAEVGRLDDGDDIVWLTCDEVLAHHEGRSVTRDLAALARLRRKDFEGFATHEIPNRLETVGPVGHGNRLTASLRTSPADQAVTTLKGTGCYPGIVESEVRVIHSPTDELSLNGKILVTVRTDPGWAPLFPTCSGLLVERGSTLSHSAVVARELGIPAIVGIPDLTRILQDGERVRLDGAAGTVEREVVPDPHTAPATGEGTSELAAAVTP